MWNEVWKALLTSERIAPLLTDDGETVREDVDAALSSLAILLATIERQQS